MGRRLEKCQGLPTFREKTKLKYHFLIVRRGLTEKSLTIFFITFWYLPTETESKKEFFP